MFSYGHLSSKKLRLSLISLFLLSRMDSKKLGFVSVEWRGCLKLNLLHVMVSFWSKEVTRSLEWVISLLYLFKSWIKELWLVLNVLGDGSTMVSSWLRIKRKMIGSWIEELEHELWFLELWKQARVLWCEVVMMLGS